MAWTNKAKISQTILRGRILTPDGNQILVGSSENLILIYQALGSNWNLKSRQAAGDWDLKTKVIN